MNKEVSHLVFYTCILLFERRALDPSNIFSTKWERITMLCEIKPFRSVIFDITKHWKIISFFLKEVFNGIFRFSMLRHFEIHWKQKGTLLQINDWWFSFTFKINYNKVRFLLLYLKNKLRYTPLEKINVPLYFEDIVIKWTYFMKSKDIFWKPMKFHIILHI